MQRVLKEIVAEIGLTVTIELVRGWGGRTLAVPMHVTEAHPLALRLGLAAAQQLVRAFAGVRLQLPAERAALLDMRNAAIWRACEEDGRSQETVGLEYGLTRQGVAAVLRKIRETQPVAGCNQAPAAEECAP
jgi:Mor family transcriptional regulator